MEPHEDTRTGLLLWQDNRELLIAIESSIRRLRHSVAFLEREMEEVKRSLKLVTNSACDDDVHN
jgi:hypothetical protein